METKMLCKTCINLIHLNPLHGNKRVQIFLVLVSLQKPTLLLLSSQKADSRVYDTFSKGLNIVKEEVRAIKPST